MEDIPKIPYARSGTNNPRILSVAFSISAGLVLAVLSLPHYYQAVFPDVADTVTQSSPNAKLGATVTALYALFLWPAQAWFLRRSRLKSLLAYYQKLNDEGFIEDDTLLAINERVPITHAILELGGTAAVAKVESQPPQTEMRVDSAQT